MRTTHPKKSEKLYGIGATIRIGQELQCLPYAGLFDLIKENYTSKKIVFLAHFL